MKYTDIIKGFTKTLKQCESRIATLEIAEASTDEVIREAKNKKQDFVSEQIQLRNLTTNINNLLG